MRVVELEYYASDVTRTFPVNGRFSVEQRALYELVLRAQLAAIAEIVPGNHWNQPHDASVKVFTQGLVCSGTAQGQCRELDQAQRLPRLLYAPCGALVGFGCA